MAEVAGVMVTQRVVISPEVLLQGGQGPWSLWLFIIV